MTGGDFKLQDILAAGTLTATTRTGAGGQAFLDYELEGPQCFTAALTTAADGRLFACFVLAPAAAWAKDKALFIAMRDSFATFNLA